MTPSQNNLGESNEKGVMECANGSLKKRLAQQLLLGGHTDFESITIYQAFIDRVVGKLKQRTGCVCLKSRRPCSLYLS